MGYHTEFTGTLYFKNELTASQITAMSAIFGEDFREHPEWSKFLEPDAGSYVSWIDLQFNDDFTGIEWSGSENTYDLASCINLIVNYMESIGKPIIFEDGKIFAQGEEATDRWWLTVKNNVAKVINITVTGKNITCPSCGEQFLVDIESTESMAMSDCVMCWDTPCTCG